MVEAFSLPMAPPLFRCLMPLFFHMFLITFAIIFAIMLPPLPRQR